MKRKYSAILDDTIKELINAVKKFDLPLAEHLIQEYNINIDNSGIYYIYGQHLLGHCLNMLRPDMFWMLLKYSTNIENYRDAQGNNLLHLAIMTHMPNTKCNDNYQEIYKYLLKYIDPHSKNHHRQSSLNIAKSHGLNLIEILSEKDEKIQYSNNIKTVEELTKTNNYLKMPLHLTKCISSPNNSSIEYSSEKTSQYKSASASEEPLLTYLKRLDSRKERLSKYFKPIVDQTKNINKQDTTTGDTPLHLAVEKNYHTGIAILLTRTDIDINILNFEGQTALDIAHKKYNETGHKGRKSHITRIINILENYMKGLINVDEYHAKKSKEIITIDADEVKTQISIPYELSILNFEEEQDQTIAAGTVFGEIFIA